jgi:DNA-directed RNA polymerase specialized sigma subunit
MIEINHNFVEKTLADYQVLQTELRAHREYLQMLFNITPAEMMEVYSIPPLADTESAFQAILSNDRQHQVNLYLVNTVRGFLDSLSDEERLLIRLRYLEAKSWACVAEHFHISIPTAKNCRRNKVLDKGISYFQENPCPPLPTVKRGLMEVIQHAPRL